VIIGIDIIQRQTEILQNADAPDARDGVCCIVTVSIDTVSLIRQNKTLVFII